MVFAESRCVYFFEKCYKEYSEWLRDYVREYLGLTLVFTLLVYVGWVGVCWQRLVESCWARFLLIVMTLLMGLTLGVLGSNKLINFLNSGELHGKMQLHDRERAGE